MHIPYFSIFYSTTFSILAFVLAVLLLVTPGDGIYQALNSGRLGQVLSIAGVYVLTLIIALLIYSTRLYINKGHLSSIPRSWIPIKKGDVSKSVHRMIIEGLRRSASIAHDAHPRDLSQDRQRQETGDAASRPASADVQYTNLSKPIWGTIAHPGWSSPSSPDLPNLHFLPVILELPHLIEAKAVSLAPSEPLTPMPSPTDPQPLPDALIVSLLQRPAAASLRDYIFHLSTLSILPAHLASTFLCLYEHARFSSQPLTEPQFRALMTIFADLLRGMTPLSPDLIADLHAEADYTSSASDSESSVEAQSLSSTDTVEHTPFHAPMPYAGGFSLPGGGLRREASEASLAGSEGTVKTAPSRAKSRSDGSRAGTGSGRSRRRTMEALRMTSGSTQTGQRKASSSASSARSGRSVIRLAEAREPLDLPYAFIAPEDGEEGW